MTTYSYRDEQGNVLYEIDRLPGKQFKPRLPGASDYGVGDVRRVLYNLPALQAHISADSREPIYVVDGEKDADALTRSGACATTAPGFAKNLIPELVESLTGARNVVVVIDQDGGAGLKQAQTWEKALHSVGVSPRFVHARVGKDSYDHIEAGHGLDEFVDVQMPRLGPMSGIEAARWFENKLRNPPDPLEEGVPTPWQHVLGTFRKGRFHLIGGYPADGKLLDLNTPLPTPEGWTTVGDIQVGDRLIDETGNPCSVTFRTVVTFGAKAYELEFSDGSKIVACADHLWLTETKQERASRERARRRDRKPWSPFSREQERLQPQVRTTQEIVDTLYVGETHANHSVRNTLPIELPDIDLALDPYLLGVWLGDGHTSAAAVTSADGEILDAFREAGHDVVHRDRYSHGIVRGGLSKQLREVGVWGDKHVPDAYLRGSYDQRLALVQGLMDTDGCVSDRGQCEFTTVLPRLAENMQELLVSLGINVAIRPCRSALYGRECQRRYRLLFTTAVPVFRLQRKLDRLRTRTPVTSSYRLIVGAREVPSRPMRCIQVDSPSHLFLAGRSMIPTHNTAMMLQFLRCACEAQKRADVFSIEMTAEELVERLVAAYGVPYNQAQSGRVSGPVRDAALRAVSEIAGWDFEIHDEPDVQPRDIEEIIADRGSDVAMVDHIHAFGHGDRMHLELMARELKGVAKRQRVPLVVLGHLSRARKFKQSDSAFPRPDMSRLRESGMLEGWADTVWFVWRHRDEFDLPTARGELIVAKSRFTQTGKAELVFDGNYQRWEGGYDGSRGA